MAGVSSKAIKNRIHSMESTKQITRAMEMVAASKLRKAQRQVQASRPYFETLCNTITDILSSTPSFRSPYLKANENGKPLYVVIAGDRGLAGGYNANVLKMVWAEAQNEDALILPVGKKALDFFRARGAALWCDSYREAEDVSVGDCFTMAKLICKDYTAGNIGTVKVAYTGFVSVLTQTAGMLPLLPLTPGEATHVKSNMLYEPDSTTVFETIVPEYLGGMIYGALCESRASEQAARRTAMDAATQNADAMIGDLSLQYNRARQAAITQEITEIVAGV